MFIDLINITMMGVICYLLFVLVGATSTYYYYTMHAELECSPNVLVGTTSTYLGDAALMCISDICYIGFLVTSCRHTVLSVLGGKPISNLIILGSLASAVATLAYRCHFDAFLSY